MATNDADIQYLYCPFTYLGVELFLGDVLERLLGDEVHYCLRHDDGFREVTMLEGKKKERKDASRIQM